MYKLIAMDLDGTLLNDKKEISDRTLEDIRRLKKMGKKIVLSTGRPLHGILPYIEILDLYDDEDYVVLYNGALVENTKGKDVLFFRPVSPDSYNELYALSKELDVNIHAMTIDNRIFTPKNNPYTEYESFINNLPVIEIPVEDVDASAGVVKVMFVDEPKKLNEIIPLLPSWVKEKYSIVRSTESFLEFLDKGINKGLGVSLIAKKFGIRPREIICVGDENNDIAMIKYAGLGVAMGNAIKDAKEAADYITLTNNEDGVAHIIEKFML